MPHLQTNKTIVIASENWLRLGKIMDALTNNLNASYTFVTITNEADLLHPLRDLSPAIVVLSFQNNQTVINRFSNLLSDKAIPVFCFTNSYSINQSSWSKAANLITYPFENAVQEDSIAQRIKAILTLNETANQRTVTESKSSGESKHWVHDLSRYTLELDQKNAILDRIKQEVESMAVGVSTHTQLKLQSLLNLIKQTKSDKRFWNDFKVYFNEINPVFLKELSQRHPSLTAKDLKYCCYLSMNLSNNEITQLLGINQESVRTHKYRLKKKMALSKEQNLEHYLILVSDKQKTL